MITLIPGPLVAGFRGTSHHAHLSVGVLVSNTGQMSPFV